MDLFKLNAEKIAELDTLKELLIQYQALRDRTDNCFDLRFLEHSSYLAILRISQLLDGDIKASDVLRKHYDSELWKLLNTNVLGATDE